MRVGGPASLEAGWEVEQEVEDRDEPAGRTAAAVSGGDGGLMERQKEEDDDEEEGGGEAPHPGGGPGVGGVMRWGVVAASSDSNNRTGRGRQGARPAKGGKEGRAREDRRSLAQRVPRRWRWGAPRWRAEEEGLLGREVQTERTFQKVGTWAPESRYMGTGSPQQPIK